MTKDDFVRYQAFIIACFPMLRKISGCCGDQSLGKFLYFFYNFHISLFAMIKYVKEKHSFTILKHGQRSQD
jgi:hypothetical protein